MLGDVFCFSWCAYQTNFYRKDRLRKWLGKWRRTNILVFVLSTVFTADFSNCHSCHTNHFRCSGWLNNCSIVVEAFSPCSLSMTCSISHMGWQASGFLARAFFHSAGRVAYKSYLRIAWWAAAFRMIFFFQHIAVQKYRKPICEEVLWLFGNCLCSEWLSVSTNCVVTFFLVMGYSSLCSVMLHALLACADSLLWFVKYGSDKQYRDLWRGKRAFRLNTLSRRCCQSAVRNVPLESLLDFRCQC